MGRVKILSIFLVIFGACLILTGLFYSKASRKLIAQQSAVHPRLLFFENEIFALKQKVTDGFARDDGAFEYAVSFADSLINWLSISVLGGDYGIKNIPLLGVVYHLSEDSNPNKYAYRDKCKDTIIYLAENYDHVHTEDPHYPSHRLLALSIGFDMCFDSASQAERQTVIEEIESYMTIATKSWNRNWQSKLHRPYINNGGVMAGSTLGLASIVLRGETANTDLLDNALTLSEEILSINLSSNFDEKGAYYEGVLYAAWAMRFFIPYIEARVRYDGYDYGQLDEVKNIHKWLVYGLRPNSASHINNLNDALFNTNPLNLHNTVVEWSQTKYNSGVAKWLYNKTVSIFNYWAAQDLTATILYNENINNINPGNVLPKSQLFPHRGLYYYRTGWPRVNETETDDSVFSFYSGKFYGGHAQEDQGQFTLYSKGENFITDTGYSNQAKQSQGHNLVMIDNNGQHNAGSSIGTDGNITHYLISLFVDYLHSDNTAAYNTYSEYNNAGYPFDNSDWSWGYDGGNPVIKAERHVLAVKKSEVGEYFIIFDDIDKDSSIHKYDWTLHTKISNTIDTTSNPVTITGSQKGNILKFYFINPDFSSLNFSESEYNNNNADGKTKRLLSTVNIVNPEFFVLMFPKKIIHSTDTDFSLTKPDVNGGLGAKLVWENNYTDYLLYNQQEIIAAESIESDGGFTLIRKNSEDLKKFSLTEGSSLTVDGVNIISIENGSASVGSDGRTISISDSSLEYIIYGPEVTSVLDSNGETVNFAKLGSLVYINTPPPLDTIRPSAITDLNTQ